VYEWAGGDDCGGCGGLGVFSLAVGEVVVEGGVGWHCFLWLFWVGRGGGGRC